MVNLIAEHMDIWTASEMPKNNGGRGRRKNGSGQSPHGIKKLRELILELAVRGKLVPQDPNDEPASVLLERIAREKARLIKEGKLKKQKPLTEIGEDEKPFDLPEGWEWNILSDLLALVTDGDHQAPPKSDSGIPFLVIGNLNTGKLIFDDCKYVPKNYYQNLDWGRKPSEGDLLYTVTGSYGIPIIVDSPEHFCVQRHVAIFKSTNSTPRKYLSLVLDSKYALDYATEIATGIAQKTVPLTRLRKMPTPVAPEKEQHRIVAKVDELMALCDQLEQQQTDSNATHQTLVETLLTTLTNAADQRDFAEAWQRMADHFDTLFTTEQSIDQFKQTILQLAVMGKLVSQDPNEEPASVFLEKITKEKTRLIKEGKIKKQKPLSEIGEDEKLFELPKGWEWVRLQQIIQISSGDGLTAANMNKDGGIPVFGGNGITGYHDKANITKPTLVIGRVGYYCGSVHITPASAWITDNAFGTTFSEQNIYINFLYWLLKGTNLKENENATAQPVISGRKVYPIIVGLPPVAEQHRIVAKVDELMTICDTLKTRLNDAQTTQVQLADAIVEKAVA